MVRSARLRKQDMPKDKIIVRATKRTGANKAGLDERKREIVKQRSQGIWRKYSSKKRTTHLRSEIHATGKESEKYKNIRRFSDGVRLDPSLGEMLALGARALRALHPNCTIRNPDVARLAIDVLADLDIVVLIDPGKSMPDWLDDADRKFAKRGLGRPIWIPRQKRALSNAFERVISKLDPWGESEG
jgi:hypothetical protein